MRYFHIIFLLSVALMSSGYRWRCYIFCDDQTGIQNDYIDNRDTCRNYAQENLAKEMGILGQDTNSPKASQATLVKLFSDCMAKYGWDVPAGSGGDTSTKVAKNEVPLYVATVSKAAPTPVVEQKEIKPLITPKPASCAKPSKKSNKKTTTNNKKKPKKQPECDTTTTTDEKLTAKPAAKKQQVTTEKKEVAKPPLAKEAEKPTTQQKAPAAPAKPEPAKPAVQEKLETPTVATPPTDAVKTQPEKITAPEEIKKPAPELPPMPTSKEVAPAPVKADPPPPHPLSDAAIDLLDSQLKPTFWQR